ncbi:MAG: sigma-54-dependent Fis family transcriptional regulator [Magnetococcales bacterium]|nr:sigma-54-dependent Fis family transcriptional regulator [Magnetococcales bacterium]
MKKAPTFSQLPVVVVDDEISVLHSTQIILSSAGIKHIEILDNSQEVMPFLAANPASVIILDLFMPYISGSQLLTEITHTYPGLPVLVMTCAQDVDTAVNSMREGAFDYLVKPVEESRLISSVKRARELCSLRWQLGTLKHCLLHDDLPHGEVFSSIITRSRRFRSIFQYVEAIAPSPEPVLIYGETGAGKEKFAQIIHALSGLSGEFVQVNVAGLDDTLFSDTLFGHKKGAFTGADRNREGLVTKAVGGTLFLDEIGDMSMASQIKLLRLLQERKYYPLGSDIAKNSDVRILCATNRPLEQIMNKQLFRSDLYFRLSVHRIEIPPLRHHKEDIPDLVNHFIEEASRSMDRSTTPTPPQELFTLLANYSFPGNVRELRAMVYDAVTLHRGGAVLSMDSFKQTISKRMAGPNLNDDSPPDGNIPEPLIQIPGRFPSLKEAERVLVDEALHRSQGNQGIAATLLGISRPALNRRINHPGETEAAG